MKAKRETRNKIIVIGVILLLLSISACTRAPEKKQEIKISDSSYVYEEPDTGTSNLAFTDYDIPPTPQYNPLPLYPVQYKKSGIQGVVLLEVEVLADGKVGEIKVRKSLMDVPGGLDEVAVSTVQTWTFKPALKKNRAVVSRVNIPIPFTLK